MLPNGTSTGAEAEMDEREKDAREMFTLAESYIYGACTWKDDLPPFLEYLGEMNDLEALHQLQGLLRDECPLRDALVTYAHRRARQEVDGHLARREAGA